ncbi:MAG: tRNA-specific adenosine deaminase [Flavobacteriales bacterium CG18_big_fil_WC_8_21_14_2_50_32_9]|nr:MAG: tRNA-specific adenosine deaminase [Flavobacteriales bacterium CG18_big_fil_WC_8_21_14_2_50_32_9]PJC61985.1 MAG: tRNA-specific adenosine deaminase [Flavobacteriales bacterium CG_4_9_14_0_2_um_filter_32_27]
MLSLFSDEFFMQEAIKEAQKAFDEDEVPVGAVIVCENKIIARAHNMTERLNDVTAHAEMLAFTSATDFLGGKYLNECTLYVTLEPCVMCAGASYWTQLKKIVFAASDEKRGFERISPSLLHPKTQVVKGILETESAQLIQTFFQQKRN